MHYKKCTFDKIIFKIYILNNYIIYFEFCKIFVMILYEKNVRM